MKFIEDMHLKNKRVILRCDFNVPIEDGKIIDNNKIIKSLRTIEYLITKNCRIIMLSHLGRVDSEAAKAKYSLAPVQKELQRLLNREVTFVTSFAELEVAAKQPLILFENTRWFDYPNQRESNNDLELAREWAKWGDVFIFDAFASAHRTHASTVGIAHYLPTGIGYLVRTEMEQLDCIKNNPTKPFAVLMGGAKVDDKLPLIKSLLPKCDYLLLGGGISSSFLKAKGIQIGQSLASQKKEILEEIKYLSELYSQKIILPVDAVVVGKSGLRVSNINELQVDDAIFDIGPKTGVKYATILKEVQTAFMNGTFGMYEDLRFQAGTIKMFNELQSIPIVVMGGGDTVAAINLLGFEGLFNVSSGGGAALEYVARGQLAVLQAIKDACP